MLKQLIVKIINLWRSHQTKTKLFGATLIDLLNYESRADGSSDEKVTTKLPRLVERITSHFLSNQQYMQKEGIFLQSCPVQELASLQGQLESKIDDVDLTTYSAYTVADCLKKFLQELSEPVIPFRFFTDFVGASTDEAKGKDTLKKIVTRMPQEHRTLLIHLIEFLQKLSSYAEVNSMTQKKLAIAFAPIICRNQNDSPGTSTGGLTRGAIAGSLLMLLEGYPSIITPNTNNNTPEIIPQGSFQG